MMFFFSLVAIKPSTCAYKIPFSDILPSLQADFGCKLFSLTS